MVRFYFKDRSFYYAAWYLILINLFIFSLQMISSKITRWGVFDSSTALHSPYVFITSLFLHASLDHVLQNMFALFLFGILLEKIVGTKNFLLVYFTGGIIGNLSFMFLNPNAQALGASGCIMAVLGALTVLRPKQIIYIYAPIPLIFLTALYTFLDIIGIFHPYSHVGYAAHLGGLVCGALWGILSREYFDEFKEKKKKVENMLLDDIDDEDIDEWENEYMLQSPNNHLNNLPAQ